MQSKFTSRARRALKTRQKIRDLGAYRLSVHRTPAHIYAQLIDNNGNVISSASTVEKTFKSEHAGIKTGNIEAASLIGKFIGERAKQKGIEKVAFDRSGFKYHGRIKALADAARASGLEF